MDGSAIAPATVDADARSEATRRPAARRRTGSASGDGGRPTGQVPALGAGGLNGAALYATHRGSLLHRPDCPVVAKRSDLKAVDPGTEGYGYCTMCDAAGAPA